jgi:hypothetical protein
MDQDKGLLSYIALMRAQIHANTFYICSKIADQRSHQGLNLEETTYVAT